VRRIRETKARLTNNMDNLSDILTRLGNHFNLNFVKDQLNQFRVKSDSVVSWTTHQLKLLGHFQAI
jgi:hypothetical protein